MKEYLELKLPKSDLKAKMEALTEKWRTLGSKTLNTSLSDFFVTNTKQIAKEIEDIENEAVIYDATYWEEVQKLNQTEFRKLGTKLQFIYKKIYYFSDFSDIECFLPTCRYDEVGKMQEYYKIIQQIIEIEGKL